MRPPQLGDPLKVIEIVDLLVDHVVDDISGVNLDHNQSGQDLTLSRRQLASHQITQVIQLIKPLPPYRTSSRSRSDSGLDLSAYLREKVRVKLCQFLLL